MTFTKDGHEQLCRWTSCRVDWPKACDAKALCPPPPAPDRWAELTFVEFSSQPADGTPEREKMDVLIRSFHAAGNPPADVAEFNRWMDGKLSAEQLFVQDCMQSRSLSALPDSGLLPSDPGDDDTGSAADDGGADSQAAGGTEEEREVPTEPARNPGAEQPGQKLGTLRISTDLGMRSGGIVSLLLIVEQSCPHIGEASKLRVKSIHYDFERQEPREVASITDWVKSAPEVNNIVQAACQELGYAREDADDRAACGLHLPWHLSEQGLAFYPLVGKPGGRPAPLLQIGDRSKLLDVLSPSVANRLHLVADH